MTESVDAKLKKALSKTKLDVERSVYLGKEKKYIVFDYNTIPDDYADDEPERERYLIAVHLFAPLKDNINSLVRSLKNLLVTAGFSYPETEDASSSSERHIVLETEITEEL